MKLNRGVTRRLRTAVSALFAVQLLVSSFCFVAPASAGEGMVSGHCHEKMQIKHAQMPMQKASHHDSGSACTHCDSPQNLHTVAYAADLTPATMLLAIFASHDAVTAPFAGERFPPANAQAPPDSSRLLFTTTQRIRI